MKKKLVQLLSAGIAFAVAATAVPAIPAFAEEGTETYSDSGDDSDDDEYEEPWRLYVFPDRPGEYYISPDSNFKYDVDTKKGELKEVLIDPSKAVLLPEDPTGVWKPNPDGYVGEVGTISGSDTWIPYVQRPAPMAVSLKSIITPGTYAYEYFHPQPGQEVKGIARYDYAFDVLELVNKERAKVGRKPLVMAESLLRTAMFRAAEQEVLYSHGRPSGRDRFSDDIFEKNDGDTAYNSSGEGQTGENIALGFADPEEVVDGWMHSDGHRWNMLNENYGAIGIGCIQTGDNIYWCQVFIADCTKTASRQENTVNTYSIPRTINAPAELLDSRPATKDDYELFDASGETGGSDDDDDDDSDEQDTDSKDKKPSASKSNKKKTQTKKKKDTKKNSTSKTSTSKKKVTKSKTKKDKEAGAARNVAAKSSKKGQICVSWHSDSDELVDVQVSTDKKFKNKTTFVRPGSTSSYTVTSCRGKKLVSGKTYYIRVRERFDLLKSNWAVRKVKVK